MSPKVVMATLCIAVLSSIPLYSAAQCTKDLDCKGDRICENGICTNSPAPQATTAAPVAAPLTGATEQPATVAPQQPAFVPQPYVAPPPTLQSVPPTNKARGLVLSGNIVLMSGVLMYVVGAGVMSIDLYIGLAIGTVGAGVAVAGDILGTTGMTIRHAAYRRAGFNPPGGRKAASWVMTSLAMASYFGGFAVGYAAYGDLPGQIASIAMIGGAAIFAAISMLINSKWDARLKQSAASTTAFTLTPVSSYAYNRETGTRTPLFGVAGTF